MIYLATPLFDDATRDYAERLTNAISKLGHRVYYPWRDAGDCFYRKLWGEGTANWRSAIFAENAAALSRCSLVVAILDGADVESGVAWEIGFAHALAKRVVGLRSDFRFHAKPDMSVNLMLAGTCAEVFTQTSDLLQFLDGEQRTRVVTVRDVTSFYNAIAHEYDDDVLHPHTAALRRDAASVAEALCSTSTVDCALDIGGGTSCVASRLSARIKFVVDPSIEMINARQHHDDIVCVGTSIEHFMLPEQTVDRAVCVLAVDHMESPGKLLEHLRPALRIGGEMVVVFQDPDEELKLRQNPNYFEFESSLLSTLFRVPSHVKRLERFEEQVPTGFGVTSRLRKPSSRFRIASTVGVRCTRVS